MPIDRWYEAISCLVTVDWDEAMAQVPELMADERASEQAMTALARQVAKKSADDSFAVLVELLSKGQGREHSRKLAATLLAVHPERGAKAIVGDLAAAALRAGIWQDALARISEHAPELALEGWAVTVRSGPSAEMRREALTYLAEHAPELAATTARDVVRDDSQPGDTRVDAAILAADLLNDGGALLTELLTASVGPEYRAMAYAAWGVRTGNRAEAIQRIHEIHGACGSGSSLRLTVPESMAVLDKEAAVALMREEILHGSHDFDTRVRELRELARWASNAELASICRSLAQDARPEDALSVARLAATKYDDVSVVEKLIREWNGSLAIDAMTVLADQHPYKAAQHLAAFARNGSESGPDRLQAARTAYRLRPPLGADALRALASDRALDAECRLVLAKSLLEFDRRRGEDILRVLVKHRSTPARVRRQAEQLLS
ncbi:hypothetical protein GCM10018954_065300 [Kutzneria kofuensis]